MSQSENIIFSNELEGCILKIINSGESNFNKILKILPGVYPVTVMECIKNLISKKYLDEDFLKQLFYDSKFGNPTFTSKPMSRIPHPLDFHWRFSQDTCDNLLNRAYKLTNPGNVIGLIGTPTLLEKPHDFFYERHIVSVDKNPLDSYTSKYFKCSSYTRDLLTESAPEINANLIIMDPPWYPEYYKSFLWTSSKICATNGHVLVVIPPDGIRPGIKNELKDIFDFAFQTGFSCVGYEKKVITYDMPQFERNALMASGLENIDPNWRTADLAILKKIKQISTPRPLVENNNQWYEAILDSIVIRIKKNNSLKFEDPTLVKLVDGDILPSVSKRDPKRDLINVWTSGNRVYGCRGTNILIYILNAIQEKKSPIELISTVINRKLTNQEICQVLRTKKKIEEIITNELVELWFN